MSRAWEKAKKGAGWLAAIGGGVGAVAGAIIGGTAAVSAALPLAGIAGAVLVGGAVTGVIWAVEGAILGAAIGGVYGAVSDDPKEKGIAVSSPQQAQGRYVDTHDQEQGMPSTSFQKMVNESRAQSAATQR